MTVSDASPYWIVDQMIWNALEDTALTNGSDLDTWRKQQNPRGNAGVNFKSGTIPTEPDTNKCPALMFRTGELDTPEYLFTKSLMDRVYSIEIIGVLKVPERREAEGDKLIKRFAHLVEKTLGEALRDLTVGTAYTPDTEANPIIHIQPGSPIFPDWLDDLVTPAFEFPIFVTVHMGSVWIS